MISRSLREVVFFSSEKMVGISFLIILLKRLALYASDSKFLELFFHFSEIVGKSYNYAYDIKNK